MSGVWPSNNYVRIPSDYTTLLPHSATQDTYLIPHFSIAGQGASSEM